jgi:hypothetical protein
MKPRLTDSVFRCATLSVILAASCATALADSSSCASYNEGIEIGGTGMGGTGVVAKGTGMGGTGITPGTAMQLAGNVISSKGNAKAKSNGHSRQLAKGDPVCVGETIVTSQAGTLQIRMKDDGLVAIRPRTRLRIDKFAYDGTDKDTSIFTLFQGAGRFVTGKIGKLHPKNDYIQTLTAIIGVRGTDHEATVILPGDRRGTPGTYDKVNKGITFIRTKKGEIDIHPNQVGVAVSAEKMPVLLKEPPDFYKTDPALKQGGSAFEAGKNGQDPGENKIDAPSLEQTGKEPENEMIVPGNAIVPEIPEPPAVPDRPDPPSLPELPKIPTLPKQ